MCTLPGLFADHELRIWKEELGLYTVFPRGQEPTRVVKMEVREHNNVDVLMAQSHTVEFLEEDVLLLDNSKALAQLWFEEEPNTSFKQDVAAVFLLNQERAAGQRDSVLFVGLSPACPEGFGGVAEHCPAVQSLAVAHECGQSSLHIVLVGPKAFLPLTAQCRSGLSFAYMSNSLGKLGPGARVGVVAPAGIFDADGLSRAVQLLEEWGYTSVLGPNLGRTHRYMAGTDAERLSDLQWALRDPDLDAVWMARGGYGLNRIVEALDLSGLDDRPVIGFSDVTSLHVALWQGAGKSGIHGPVLHSLCDHPSEASRQHLKALLQGERNFSLAGEIWRPGSASGPVVGGNLCMLASLCGSRFQLETNGCILVIEDIGEPPYKVDRMLQQLEMAGVLKGIAGVAVGDFSGCTAPEGERWGLKSLICEAVDVPVLGALPIGHGAENRAFVFGASARIDGDCLVFGG